jgi:hypothetical protein
MTEYSALEGLTQLGDVWVVQDYLAGLFTDYKSLL